MAEVASEQAVPEPAERKSTSLRSRAIRASGWVVVGFTLSLIIRLAGSLIMTRLLVPEIYGVMAVVGAVQYVLGLLADIGLRQAVVQSQNGEKQEFLNTAWTLQILRGFMICGACCAAAIGFYLAAAWGYLPSESAYAAPALPLVIAVSGTSAIINGLQTMKSVVFGRQLNLQRLIIIDLIGQVINLIVAATVGWMTHSIWSFIAGGLIGQVTLTLLSVLWLPGPLDRLAWNREAVRELLHFGRWIAISSAISVLAMNGDRLLLGAWVTPAVLGYYSIAFNLTTVAEAAANRFFSSISLPALSEVWREHPERFPALYSRMRWFIDAAFIGGAGCLFATAHWIVGLLYDPRYAEAGTMLQLLSFYLLFPRYGLAQSAYLAIGRPNYVTMMSVARTVSLFTLVPGLYTLYGVEGAVLGIGCHQALWIAIVAWCDLKHRLTTPLQEVVVYALWPLGWLAGQAFLAAVAHFHAAIS